MSLPRPEPIDLGLLREAAEAGFHLTPPATLALIRIIEDLEQLLGLQHDTIEALAPQEAPPLRVVQPWVAPWRKPAPTVEQPSLFEEP